MAKELQSIIQIDNEDYSITAAKVTHTLTVKSAGKEPVYFDGSKDVEVELVAGGTAENASKIEVHLDNEAKAYATLTISTEEPEGGSIGDIWFKV